MAVIIYSFNLKILPKISYGVLECDIVVTKLRAYDFVIKYFYCGSVTVVSPFSSLLTPILPPPLPQSIPPIVSAHKGSICVMLLAPSLSSPCHPPRYSPLVTVSLFFISISLAIFSLLVCFVD